jgi:hypothetical protein
LTKAFQITDLLNADKKPNGPIPPPPTDIRAPAANTYAPAANILSGTCSATAAPRPALAYAATNPTSATSNTSSAAAPQAFPVLPKVLVAGPAAAPKRTRNKRLAAAAAPGDGGGVETLTESGPSLAIRRVRARAAK